MSTIDLSDIFAYVDQHEQAFLTRLIDYLRRPSISAYGEEIGEVAEYIAGVMREIGLDVRIMPTAGWPMVFGEYRARADAPTVLLYGHYDVQPPDPLEEWISPPFEPAIRDGNLYARGAADDKGQLFILMEAVARSLRENGSLPVNVKFLIEGEEESGGEHLEQYVP